MIEQELRARCRALLESGDVQVVVGYGGAEGEAPHPVFVTEPAGADRLVWNERCYHNLTGYLTRPEVRSRGRAAVVVKGCDARAVVVLQQESQLRRDDVVVVGVACAGVGDPPAAKCRACDVRMPRHCDLVIGKVEQPPVAAADRYADVEEFLQLPAAERMAYWTAEFERCVRCYACRQVCPLCFCRVCVMDKNRPRVVDPSPHVKGNLAFHLTRAFHLAGRCAGCDECSRACPAGIDLRLLNLSMERAAEERFGFRAGTDPDAEPLGGRFSTQDREEFIQ